jgi:uncharacterized protein YjbI with pentapeptide repeats
LENLRFLRDRLATDPTGTKPFAGLNLGGTHLAQLDLSCIFTEPAPDVFYYESRGCADLSQADLSETNLSGTDLRGAALVGANLASADLTYAKLECKKPEESYEEGEEVCTDLTGAILTDARLLSTWMSGATLTMADLRDADLTRAELQGAVLYGADLFGADLERASLRGAEFSCHEPDKPTKEMLLDEQPWEEGEPDQEDLVCASLARANLRRADVRGAILNRADLTGAVLDDVCWDSGTQWPPPPFRKPAHGPCPPLD